MQILEGKEPVIVDNAIIGSFKLYEEPVIKSNNMYKWIEDNGEK